MLKRLVVAKDPKSVGDLERVAKHEWKRLTSERPLLDSLFSSMPERLREVKKLRGGKTKY